MSVQPDVIRQHIDRILGEEAVLLAELEQVLTREAVAVRGDDAAAIENIGGARHQCIDSLMRLDGERASACRMLSLGTGPEAIDRLLSWCDPDQSLRRRWQSNLAITRRCKELNDRNGAIVTLKLEHVRQRLAAMRGSTAGPVYGRQGLPYQSIAGRELGQA
jgi:flagellar biosynthesis/type III secretory pathway chaperone